MPRLTDKREGVFLAVPSQEVTANACKAVHAPIKGVDEVISEEAATAHRRPAGIPFCTQHPWSERPQVSTAGATEPNHSGLTEMRLHLIEIGLWGKTFPK